MNAVRTRKVSLRGYRKLFRFPPWNPLPSIPPIAFRAAKHEVSDFPPGGSLHDNQQISQGFLTRPRGVFVSAKPKNPPLGFVNFEDLTSSALNLAHQEDRPPPQGLGCLVDSPCLYCAPTYSPRTLVRRLAHLLIVRMCAVFFAPAPSPTGRIPPSSKVW